MPDPPSGSIDVDESTLALALAPGSAAREATAVLHVHVRTNAARGFRLMLSALPTEQARGSAAPRIQVHSGVAPAGLTTQDSELGVESAAVVDSPLPQTSTADIELKLVVADDFTIDPGTYHLPLQVVFEPRYER